MSKSFSTGSQKNEYINSPISGKMIKNNLTNQAHASNDGTFEEVIWSTLESIYKYIPTNDGIALSPYSIAYALSIVYLGASGQTKEQIKRTMGISLSDADLIRSLSHNLGY